MKKLTLIVATCTVLLAQSEVFAAGTDVRQANQRARIVDGIVDGELTRGEAKRLAKQQRHIARTENRFKADGTYTAKERLIVNHKQNKASRRIYRQKHDAQTR